MKRVDSIFFSPPALKLIRSESGVTLVLVLVLMVILGLSAGIAGSTWSSLTRRAREADLLWKGGQIRAAIGTYYQSSHGQGAAKIYPSKLKYLLKDPRFLQTKRHLRRPYLDPMTGSDWELIKDQGGRIKGVRSTLKEEPFKQGNFSPENEEFEGRGFYNEWEFVYVPKKAKSGVAPTPTGGALPPAEGIPPSANSESPQG